MDPISRGIRTVPIVATFAIGREVRIASQRPTDPPETRAAPGPISCWWRTDKPAVRIGEAFGLTLTCRVLSPTRPQSCPMSATSSRPRCS